MRKIPDIFLQVIVLILSCFYSMSFFVFSLGIIEFGIDIDSFSFFISSKRLIFLNILFLVFFTLIQIHNYKIKIRTDKIKFSELFLINNIGYYILTGLLIGLTIIFFSNWSEQPYSFSSKIRFKDFYLSTLILLFPTLFFNYRIIKYIIPTFYFILVFSFFYHTKGQALFTDDHASVIYRLHLLSKNFPSIPIYNTSWNAGTDWRDFFATGILNVFLIFYFPLKIWGSTEVYRIILPSLLFLIFPLSIYIGSRITGLSKTAGILASFLGITSSITFYKWALSYGSLGFICSLVLSPLAFSSLLKLNDTSYKKLPLSKNLFLACGIVTSLSFFWSMQVVAFLPILLTTLIFCIKPIMKNKTLRIILFGVLIFNLAWVMIFIKVSKVSNFIESSRTTKNVSLDNNTQDKNAKIAKFKLEEPIEIAKVNILRINPILIVLFLPSLFFCKLSRLTKISYSIIFFWLLSIGIFGPEFKPQLELDRLLLIFSVLATIPVAAFIDHYLNYKDNFLSPKVNQYLLSAFIIVSSSSVASILQNRGWFTFSFLPKELNEIASQITSNAGRGRAIFSGFVLHELNNGHIAPIAQLTSTPLIASSPVHNLWWYTDVIPQEFRIKGDAGIEEYYDLMNVTLTIAHDPKWRKYYNEKNTLYKKISTIGKFTLFERKKTSNYFLSGDGEIILQNESEIKLRLKTKDATIKFIYYPFLEVKNCKTISPNNEHLPLSLVKIENCSLNNEIIIKSINPIQRIFH